MLLRQRSLTRSLLQPLLSRLLRWMTLLRKHLRWFLSRPRLSRRLELPHPRPSQPQLLPRHHRVKRW